MGYFYRHQFFDFPLRAGVYPLSPEASLQRPVQQPVDSTTLALSQPAFQALKRYAANKSIAMACRSRGEIQAALRYEEICDQIYKLLPDYARFF